MLMLREKWGEGDLKSSTPRHLLFHNKVISFPHGIVNAIMFLLLCTLGLDMSTIIAMDSL